MNIWFVSEEFVSNFIFKWIRTNFWHTSIVIVSTQLNGFNYCYLTVIILFNINDLFADSEVVTNIAI